MTAWTFTLGIFVALLLVAIVLGVVAFRALRSHLNDLERRHSETSRAVADASNALLALRAEYAKTVTEVSSLRTAWRLRNGGVGLGD